MSDKPDHRDLLQVIAEHYKENRALIDEMVQPGNKPENPSKIRSLTKENDSLRQQLAESQARVDSATALLQEHFEEWELDTDKWDEFGWHDRVASYLESSASEKVGAAK